jgi:hypothetical protein
MATVDFVNRLLAAGIYARWSPEGRHQNRPYPEQFVAARFICPASVGIDADSIFVHGMAVCTDRCSADSLHAELGGDWAELINAHCTPEGEVLLGDFTTITRGGSEWVFENSPVFRFGGENPDYVRFASPDLRLLQEAAWNFYFGMPLRLEYGWYVPVHRRPQWQPQHIVEAFRSTRTITRKALASMQAANDGIRFVAFPNMKAEPYTLMVRDDGREIWIVDERLDEWLHWGIEHGFVQKPA